MSRMVRLTSFFKLRVNPVVALKFGPRFHSYGFIELIGLLGLLGQRNRLDEPNEPDNLLNCTSSLAQT